MIEITSLCGNICIGKQGENLARMVRFDEPEIWKDIYGEGKCELLHQRSGDAAPYPVVLENEGDKVCWKITESDTAMIGEGKCELHYSVDGVVVKSKIWTTTVFPSLGEASEEPPEPAKAWVDQVLKAAENVESATTHQPTVGGDGNWYVWDAETKGYVDSGVLAEGKPGANGKDGVDGVNGKDGVNGSNGVSCTHSWDGTVLSVTSASGTSSANLKGEQGIPGEKGTPGDTGPQGQQGEKGEKGDIGPQGQKGDTGPQGADGYTPLRGIDYWTDDDIAEIKSYVDDAILGGAW